MISLFEIAAVSCTAGKVFNLGDDGGPYRSCFGSLTVIA